LLHQAADYGALFQYHVQTRTQFAQSFDSPSRSKMDALKQQLNTILQQTDNVKYHYKCDNVKLLD